MATTDVKPLPGNDNPAPGPTQPTSTLPKPSIDTNAPKPPNNTAAPTTTKASTTSGTTSTASTPILSSSSAHTTLPSHFDSPAPVVAPPETTTHKPTTSLNTTTAQPPQSSTNTEKATDKAPVVPVVSSTTKPASSGAPSASQSKTTSQQTSTTAGVNKVANPITSPIVSSVSSTSSTSSTTTPIISESGLASTDSGFLQNRKAVAGVFVVVGLVALLLVVILALIFRSKRRAARRLAQAQASEGRIPSSFNVNPFEDPPDSPSMQAVHEWDRTLWSQRERSNNFQYQPAVGMSEKSRDLMDTPDFALDTSGHQKLQGGGLGGITTAAIGKVPPSPFSDAHEYRGVPMAIGFLPEHMSRSQPSLTQSSPSIYPVSLPGGQGEGEEADEEDDRIFQRQPARVGATSSAPISYPFPTVPVAAYVVEAPPRPPRSQLRHLNTARRNGPDGALLPTPPASSVSSHGDGNEHSQVWDTASSPGVGRGDQSPHVSAGAAGAGAPVLTRHPSLKERQEQIQTRRTLLDVRPRASRDSMEISPYS